MDMLRGVLPSLLWGATPEPAPVGPPQAAPPAPVPEVPLYSTPGLDRGPIRDEAKAHTGLRPRDYHHLLDGSNEAERQFLAELPKVTKHLNEMAEKNGWDFRFDQAELATNFIGEGGILPLRENRTKNLDGYSDLGIDTFVDRKQQLAPWMTPELDTLVKSGKHRQTNTNELGESVTTINPPTMAEGLQANAVMFALSRQQFHEEMKKQGKDASQLTPEEQFFWTTSFFNAGPGLSRRMLEENGVEWAHKKWTGPDDDSQNKHPRYNAQWRTSTYEYLKRTTSTSPPPAAAAAPFDQQY
jgi:hypothetical protein